MKLTWLYSHHRLLKLVWPFVLTVILQVALGMFSLNILSAVRAYVGGESLWSKAQKDAIYALYRYADSGDIADFQHYQSALAITSGDRQAREALDQANPNREQARDGFLAGGNAPHDIDSLIWLFVEFRNDDDIAHITRLWQEGDRLLDELAVVALRLNDGYRNSNLTPAKQHALRQHIYRVNDQITPLTKAFSRSLSDLARRVENILLLTHLFAGITLVGLALWRTSKLLAQSENYALALGQSEERFKLAVQGSNDGIWDWDMRTGAVYFSPRYKELLGFSADDPSVDFATLTARLHPEDRERALDALRRHLANEAHYDVEYRLRTRAGDYRWYRARGRVLRNAEGTPQRMSGSLTDVTDRKQVEADLNTEKERAEATLAAIGEAVITTDAQDHVEYMNPGAEQLLGCTLALVRGKPLSSLFRLVEAQRRHIEVALHTLTQQALPPGIGSQTQRNLLLIQPDGDEVAVDITHTALYTHTSQLQGHVLVLHDMTREQQYLASLSWQASHDMLTGLYNRREFERRLLATLATAEQDACALMYLDLDQFKTVNDTCGHAAGDALLRQTSAILQQQLDPQDLLARLGGDEFGVLLPHCSPERAEKMAETLRQRVLDLNFTWGGQLFSVSVSIGLVCLDHHPATLAEVLRAADVACYMAKEKGRNRVQFYRPQDSEVSVRYDEMEWVHRIHRALEDDRFCLYAQTILPLQAHVAGAHFEVLLRLRDEQGDLVPPIAFIPAAERYNLMPLIDRWVVSATLGALAARQAQPDAAPLGMCAINLSGASIGDEQFLSFLRDSLRHSPVPTHTLCFEITETSAIANLATAAHVISELRALGCHFALDDFGAGMSSFAYLKHLPVDYLKIDGSFVKDMVRDPIDRAMVEMIQRIANIMNKHTIAEYVEDTDTLELLRSTGVNYAQGYGIARPQPFYDPPPRSARQHPAAQQ